MANNPSYMHDNYIFIVYLFYFQRNVEKSNEITNERPN